MLRRSFLLSATALTGCASVAQTFDSKLAQVVSDVSLIARGIGQIVPQVMSFTSLTPTGVAAIQQAAADIAMVADQIKSVTSIAAAQPWVQKLETYLNTIVTILAAMPLPPQISVALQAATVLLPVIEMLVGLLTNINPAAGRFQTGAMSPDQARLVLAGSAAKK